MLGLGLMSVHASGRSLAHVEVHLDPLPYRPWQNKLRRELLLREFAHRVGEPTTEDTISILRGLKEKYELHHGVRIADAALVAATTLSNRYISDRFLPDKAIDLVDEAASRLRMEVDSKPEHLDELDRRIIPDEDRTRGPQERG